MKSQKHNVGELIEVTIKLEKSLRESLTRMSKNSGMTEDEIIVIALKRFRSHHADYEDTVPSVD